MSTGQAGSADSTPSASASQLYLTLAPVLLVSGAFTVGFLVLRRYSRRFYSPRSFLPTLREQERSPDLPNGLFNWIGPFMKIPDTYVLNHNSLDAYLLLRYLKVITAICFVGCCITWPILWPVNATGHGGQSQLEVLSFSNVSDAQDKNRLYAHTFVAWIYFGFIFYMVMRESIFYINLRQAYLLSPLYASRMSSRTVLFNSVPEEYLDEVKLRQMFGNKLKNLWLSSDTKELQDKVEERDKVAMKLEAAETKLIKTANDARLKSIKKGGSNDEEQHLGSNGSNGSSLEGESGSLAAKWIRPKDRPTHRPKFLIGKKVDTINWCRAELERLIPEVDAMQATHRAGQGKPVGSVFVEFYTQSEAQAAFQMVAHHQALHMAPRTIGINPDSVIWKNLRIKWWERIIRNISTNTFVTLLVIFWAIPVAVVGSISNISSIDQKVFFLHWIQKIPQEILGLIQGLLPSVLLAVLMALLPIILRWMARLSGLPTLARAELRTQNSYFLFQVIQVFLVTTLTSAATASAQQIIQNPSSATTLLAQDIPKASNFYISYLILQGLTISSGAVLQLVGYILFRVLGKFLDTTPRKMYKRYSGLSALGWGTVFPIYSLLIVIAITYSIIAPLVLGFATIGLYLIYLANRYNLLFVNTSNLDTQGLVYPRALQQTTTGVYLAVVVLIGLFAIRTAIGPLILMIVFLVFIALFHISLNSAIEPLLIYLPKSLEAEEEALLSVEEGPTSNTAPTNPKETTIGTVSKNGSTTTDEKMLPPAPHKKPNFLTKFLRPDKYTDYQTLRRLVPQGFADISYSPEVERDAYYNPAISSPPTLLWIPRDPMGVSRQEVLHTSKVIPITDEGAGFDEKGKMVWNPEEVGRPPVWQEKIYY